MTTETVYLDNNASTALDPRVLEAMLPVLRQAANASSAHAEGRWTRQRVELAREQLAALVDAVERNVLFTSGATEANNLAIAGAAAAAADAGMGARDHVVTCSTEHPAVLEVMLGLRRHGFRVSVVGVDRFGVTDLAELRAKVDHRTLLVSVMAVNNETGVLAPLAQIAEIAQAAGALMHTDATQLMAWGPVSMADLGVDMMSVSAHKFHGPQGVGALIASTSAQKQLAPLSRGGGHERGLRSGTLNAAGITGLGEAAHLVGAEGPAAAVATRVRRDELHVLLIEPGGGLPPVLNGHLDLRAPGTLNLGFPGVSSDILQAAVPEVIMSDGSACSAGVPGPSHVLSAMRVPKEVAEGSVRLSLSRLTTDADVQTAAAAIRRGLNGARSRLAQRVAP